MNKEEPYREQAERLKRRIEKINEEIEFSSDELPPREQLHRERKTKVKWKLKYPVIRILVLFFILLPVIIFSVISYLDGKKSQVSEPASNDSVGYETINLETKSEETKPEEAKKVEEEESQPAAREENQESAKAEEATPDSQPVTAQPNENNEGTQAAQSTGSEAAPVRESAPVSGTSTDKNSQPAKKTSVNQTKAKVIYHKVQPKETLYRLSMKYYNSQKGMEIIKNANGLKSEEIMAGQVLKIPLN